MDKLDIIDFCRSRLEEYQTAKEFLNFALKHECVYEARQVSQHDDVLGPFKGNSFLVRYYLVLPAIHDVYFELCEYVVLQDGFYKVASIAWRYDDSDRWTVYDD